MLHDVNEPAYRVVLTHQPEDMTSVTWTANLYTPPDAAEPAYTTYGLTRERALQNAIAWVKAVQAGPEPSATFHLNAVGDLLDDEAQS